MDATSVREGYLPVPGGNVWYRIVGVSDAPPLVVLHGGPGIPHDYLSPLQQLSDERPIVFYDQLGCGKSDRPDDPSLWQIDRFMVEFAQLRQHLQLDTIHLFGHSWGTMLAVDTALSNASGIRSLILASPILSYPRTVAEVNRLLLTLPTSEHEAIRRHTASGTFEALEYQQAVDMFSQQYLCRVVPPPELMLQAFSGMNPVVYQTMHGPSEFTVTGNCQNYDRLDQADKLRIPTLLTCGRYDEITPELTAMYQQVLPEADIVVFEHSAHMAHLEETESYLAAVRSFLKRVEAV